ncbi:MAG: MmgE/PrpD family protein [Candidatus Rokubacteria bacterium]|nr:MmgE/PrpD family protein [Candidatus Rokubacteria bacterium]
MATWAETLAEFTRALTFEAIPRHVTESAQLRCLDVLGIALASTVQDFAPSVLAVAESWGGGGECTVVGTKLTASPPLAILANGSLAHGLDYDDTHTASITHASAVVIPTALALGESLGLDGRSVLTAAVAGYEAITRIGMAAPGAFHARGWHATAVCGAFAATLVAGKCLGLNGQQLTAALGIAGSFASGVLEHLEDGSWVKRIHPGWAGHSGALAAGLAQGGFTGPASILEGRFGFYSTFLGRRAELAPGLGTLGQEWETLRVAFKPYPCCHYNHAYMDAAARLKREHRFSVDEIEGVECLVPAGEVPIVCEPAHAKRRPRTSYDAQFSLPFSVALALVEDQVSVDSYAPEKLTDPVLLALADRVSYSVDPTSRFPESFPGWVKVRLRDGTLLEAREPANRGSPENPLQPEAIVAKFRLNGARVLPASQVALLEREVFALDRSPDVRSLLGLCRIP